MVCSRLPSGWLLKVIAMTVTDALGKWAEACSATKAGEQIIRNGNWTPIARALRHCKGGTIEEAGKLNSDTVLLVTPAEPQDVPAGKEPIRLSPFLLVVK